MTDWDELDRRGKILALVDDLVGAFLYYDRKECEEHPRGSIEAAIADGTITVDDIIAEFATKLRASL